MPSVREGLSTFGFDGTSPAYQETAQTKVEMQVMVDGQPKPITREFCALAFDADPRIDGSQPFPQGMDHDLALLTPTAPIRMNLGQPRRFLTAEETKNLAFNTPITILAPDSPFNASSDPDGRTFASRFGPAIGKRFWKKNKKYYKKRKDLPILSKAARSKAARAFEKQGEQVRYQFSRSILWRVSGKPQSVQGWSGAPIEIVGGGNILGFQNWMWTKATEKQTWAEDDEELGRQDEDEARVKSFDMRYNIYGSYVLPERVLNMEIAEPNF
ncbi:hypothetical protein BJ508DRAFT_330866 [Ascobolus immersus RN42]|uniref:Uncharacterized protein n=1 Tax=Ascobolus immersus RN42 TaxID=1160509 RepID=A0A3N4HW00_ASCIM|nr:hypothetical protein BJ508DRAFT_330866 [Ascobolus immersus RN42]